MDWISAIGALVCAGIPLLATILYNQLNKAAEDSIAKELEKTHLKDLCNMYYNKTKAEAKKRELEEILSKSYTIKLDLPGTIRIEFPKGQNPIYYYYEEEKKQAEIKGKNIETKVEQSYPSDIIPCYRGQKLSFGGAYSSLEDCEKPRIGDVVVIGPDTYAFVTTENGKLHWEPLELGIIDYQLKLSRLDDKYYISYYNKGYDLQQWSNLSRQTSIGYNTVTGNGNASSQISTVGNRMTFVV